MFHKSVKHFKALWSFENLPFVILGVNVLSDKLHFVNCGSQGL